jgi:hypothetical protein
MAALSIAFFRNLCRRMAETFPGKTPSEPY